MYLNPHPIYRRRRAVAATLAAAAVFTGSIACSAATDTTPAPDTRKVSEVVTTERTPSLKDREDVMILQLRSVNVVPEKATARQARHEGFEMAMDFRRTVEPTDAAGINAKVVQHADRLQTIYGVTPEQGAYWVGAALRAYMPAYADTIGESR